MHEKKLLALYGLKYNPFSPGIPVQSLWEPPGAETFFFRVENLVMAGGFALVCGEPGMGKSKCLQILAHKLETLDDVVVGVMERPQSSIGDFYREMGELFQVNLTPANRYGGFRALRERWNNHIQSTLFRPVLIIDEAQEMISASLNELRLLTSAHFDSRYLLTIILSGDMRLPERFRSVSLLSLGSRIQTRMHIEPYDRKQLLEFLDHSLAEAGASHLITQELKETLADHAAGNLRLLNTMAAELLARGAQEGAKRLTEKLFIEAFSRMPPAGGGGKRKKNRN